MKNLNLVILLFYFLVISCTSNSNKEYEIVSSPQGGQAVYVQNGNESFWMDYVLFNSLMRRGGMNNVRNYYSVNHTTIINNQSRYSTLNNYRKNRIDVNNNKRKVINLNNSNTNKNSYTSSITKSTPFYTSPIRNISKSTYSSPIRTPSYSSPTRSSSYTSPSRIK